MTNNNHLLGKFNLNVELASKGIPKIEVIFYVDENQKKIAKKIIEEKNKKLPGKVVTNLSLLKNYCTAEDYHQKYLEKKV